MAQVQVAGQLNARGRLRGEPAPHLLMDALWLQRPTGGITRVWEQILTTWSLPGLVSAAAPITLIDREGRSALLSRFALVERSGPEARSGPAHDPFIFARRPRTR